MAFTATVMLCACKKSDDSSKKELCTKISSMSYTGSAGSETYAGVANYSYDDKGRLIKDIDTDGEYGHSYTYGASTIKVETTEGSEINTYNFTLDGSNRIVKEGNDTFSIDYKYDSNGYLSEQQDGDYKTKFTWFDGNLLKKEEFYNGASTPTTTTTYTYFEEIATDSYYLTDWRLLGVRTNVEELYNYFGKHSKNLVKQIKEDTYAPYNYEYLKDAQGRVTKVIVSYNSVGNESLSTTSVVYKCD